MAISGADLGVVDPLAADLINFSRSMLIPRFRVAPAAVVAGGIAAAALLVAISPTARAAFVAGCPASGPCPTPTPLGANIVLDIAAGGPSTHITATGSSFLANEQITLYWDTPSHVAASVTADSSGSFTKVVTPFPGDTPGVHRLCASVPPNPCANFTLQGSPTPTPAVSPSPSPSASPSASPSSTPIPTPLVITSHGGRNGLDVITKPPFVFLPIIGLLALLAALVYWLLMRVERSPVLPSASVVHRSARPDMGPTSPTGSGAPATTPAPEMQPPPADLPPPPAPFDPTGQAGGPPGTSETSEHNPY